jgi:response regulator RpfG family c-di-GMP phosphodiesterase
LYQFTRMLNLARTRDEILDLTIRTVQEVTGSQRVSILLKEEGGHFLRCARAAGMDESLVPRIRVSTKEGIAGQVFSTGRTFVATASSRHDGVGHYESDTFVSTPLVATSLMTREETLGVLSITDKPSGEVFSNEEVECIRSIADSGAIALHNQIHRERLDESVNVLLMTVGRLAEFRDNETGTHLERVREYARLLATELQRDSAYSDLVTDEFVSDIYRAAPMHDIGKVGVPDSILCKPAKLTDEEFRTMKEHCRIGCEVIGSAVTKTGPLPILTMCREIAESHHERWDGNGYPNRLSGEKIPLSARIIAIADAYDAITSARRYKGAKTHDEAIDIICADAGKHFDPEIVKPCLRIANQFDEIRELHRDPDDATTQDRVFSINV